MFSLTISIEGKDLDTKSFDNILIGKWSGVSSTDDGFYQHWIHIKKEDGTYQTTFSYFDINGAFSHSKKMNGKWWTTLESVYMSESWMAKPIHYKYRKLTNNCIKYSLVSGDKDDNVTDDYSFTDCPYKANESLKREQPSHVS